MIGLLVLTYEGIGTHLVEATSHVLGCQPEQLEALPVTSTDTPESLAPRLKSALTRQNTGDGVLILTDLYGTTHCNVASAFIENGNTEMISGLNMAMLLRAITYRNENMATLLDKVFKGGHDGINICKKLDNYSKIIK